MGKKSFRQILRERERERQRKKKNVPPMPDLDDPIYKELEPEETPKFERPPDAPSYFNFLIDGHNCIYQLSKEDERIAWNYYKRTMFESIIKYRKAMQFYYDLTTDFEIYMDNYQSQISHRQLDEGVMIYYTLSDHGRDAADIEIVEIVRLNENPEELIVASSDRYCQQVEQYGVKLFSSIQFLEIIRTQLPPDYIGDYNFR